MLDTISMADTETEAEKRLTVIESNNLESLADMCAMIMSTYPLSDVFIPEKLVIMNLGMKNFLTQRITLQNKISAMCDYTQIWQFIFSIFYEFNQDYAKYLPKLLPKSQRESGEDAETETRFNLYDREHMKWNIFSQICRRQRCDLVNLVNDYDSGLYKESSLHLKFFDEHGAYSITAAKEWLKEHPATRNSAADVVDTISSKAAKAVDTSSKTANTVDTSNKTAKVVDTSSGNTAKNTDAANDNATNAAQAQVDKKAGTLASSQALGVGAAAVVDNAEENTEEDVKSVKKGVDSAKEDVNNAEEEAQWSFIDLDPSSMFDKIRDYVSNEYSDDRAYELAAKIADTFDQYQIYRPQWLLQWNKFTLQDFVDYEQNPDDTHNPINIFINEECLNYAKRKSGLISITRRQAYDKLAREIREFGSLEAAESVHKAQKNKLESGNKLDGGVGDDDFYGLSPVFSATNPATDSKYGAATDSKHGSVTDSKQGTVTDNKHGAANSDTSSEVDGGYGQNNAHPSFAANTEFKDAEFKQAGLDVSTLDMTPERRAQILAEAEEQDRQVLTSSVVAVRNNFKQNIWQMKLWCLLRPMLKLDTDEANLTAQEQDKIYKILNSLDRAQVLNRLNQQLKDPSYKVHLSCERVFVFGVSALPQCVVDFLTALANRMQVFILLFNPCHKFWADLNSYAIDNFQEFIKKAVAAQANTSKYTSLLRRKVVAVPDLKESLKRSSFDRSGERVEGHPLLLSYGRQCKDLLNMLLDVEPTVNSVSCFSEPLEEGTFTTAKVASAFRKEDYEVIRGGTLLKYLQNSIFDLDNGLARYEIAHTDRSLVIHSCYTIRREVEVLKDNLLRLFNEHRCPYRQSNGGCIAHKLGHHCEYRSRFYKCQRTDLLPRDIVVMVPAINTYAPHISAVFGEATPSDPDYIPYVISDQTETEANTAAAAMLRLLEINSERITSVMVIELLNEPSIARRFDIRPEDVDVISTWLTENNVFWGLDQDDAQEVSQIDIPGTFSHGLDRMILGTMLGETEHTPCFSEIEGNDAQLLGKLWSFIHALRELRQHFKPELQQTPKDWQNKLQFQLRQRFFDDSEETTRALACIDKFISDLNLVFSHLKQAPRITLQVFAAALRKGLTAVRNFTPYYGEKVNFCSLVPMRAVPFKHVFILGMNDGDFPRQNVYPAFNILNNRDMFCRGDRSPALDDRFLFLEALLSARETLYLSYIGQSPVDQSERNPSLVLSELLYFINDRCQLPLPEDQDARRIMEMDLGKAVLDRLVIKERLNAYHADNYTLVDQDKELLRLISEYGWKPTKEVENLESNATDNLSTDNVTANTDEVNDAADITAGTADTADNNDVNNAAGTTAAKSSLDSPFASPVNPIQDLWNTQLEQPYQARLKCSPLWRLPSFNHSFINLQQTFRAASPILGEGSFASLVGLQEVQVLDLDKVISFCKNPCRNFMSSKLRMSLNADNKTSLSTDEIFTLDFLGKISAVSSMVELPEGEQKNFIDYQSALGAYPYGVFKELLQDDLMNSYSNILQSLKQYDLSSASDIQLLPSARHYEFTLKIPKRALWWQLNTPDTATNSVARSVSHNTFDINTAPVTLHNTVDKNNTISSESSASSSVIGVIPSGVTPSESSATSSATGITTSESGANSSDAGSITSANSTNSSSGSAAAAVDKPFNYQLFSPEYILQTYNHDTAYKLEALLDGEDNFMAQNRTDKSTECSQSAEGNQCNESNKTSAHQEHSSISNSDSCDQDATSSEQQSAVHALDSTLSTKTKELGVELKEQGEELVEVHITLQLNARSQPIVIDGYSEIKSKEIKDDEEELSQSQIDTALGDDCNIILNCTKEAIAQCLYEALEPTSGAGAVHGQPDQVLQQPMMTPLRLRDIILIDRNGRQAKFTKFNSVEDVIFILKELVLFYILASCAPFPSGRQILKSLVLDLENKTIRVKEDQSSFDYDQEAKYFFGSLENIQNKPMLSQRTFHFMNFMYEKLLPHYKPFS